jgi:dihydroneopterin aldolase
VPFILRAGMNVGAMSAEDDAAFLEDCFVQTSDLDQISSSTSSKCIALGRTGAGKSAILLHLENRYENVVRLSPDSLSLNYISNSDILTFFENIDIDLDVFYQLLWRHVLTVELLQLKKQLSDERTSERFIANLFERFNPNEKKKRALDYLFNYGNSFWSDTEHRVREVVHKIEESLEQQIGFSVEAFKARLAADNKDKNASSMQQTTEIITRAQKVVNGVQFQELNTVMEFLADDVFNDSNIQYFIVIDDLDTGWVHDKLRFKLVRALIETLKKFKRIRNLKIVVGLRADLLETVLNETSAKGFQTEKYEDMMLRLKWSRSDLKTLADKRIAHLFKDQYASQTPVFEDIFAARVGHQDTFDYILDRSLYRPRDVIVFINECLDGLTGGATIGQKTVRNAEASYSKKRLRSIADEWREAYGDLEEPINILREVDVRFTLKDLTDDLLEGLCINLMAGDIIASTGVFVRECEIVAIGSSYARIRRRWFEVMYIIGAIGVRLRKGGIYEWSYKNEPLLDYTAINDETLFAIHPMLFRVLNKRADPTSLV